MTFDTFPVAPTFPVSELGETVELLLGSTWTDVSGYTLQDSTNIQRGHPDESTTASPSAFAALWDNSDGRFSSLNPLGAYYGQIGLNTPVRVSIPEGASYLRLENDSSSGVFAGPTVNNAALANGLDIQVDVTPDNWYTCQLLAGEWASSGNNRSFEFGTNPNGTLWFKVSSDGSTSAATVSQALTVNPHARLCVRVVWSASTGNIAFYTATGSLGASPAWVSCGSLAGWHATAMYTSATGAPYAIGCLPVASDMDSGVSGLNGKFHAAIIQTLTPTVVASPDFTSTTPGSLSYSDGQSHTWQLFGTSEVSNRKYRFHGEVAAWPQAWKPAGNNAKVNVAAGGLLRRIGQGQDTLQSSMFRAYARLTGAGIVPWAYWPCEDGVNATQIASGIGGQPITFGPAMPAMASFSTFACSQAIPVTSNGAYWTANVPAYTVNAYGTGYGQDAVVRFLMAVPSGGDTVGATIASVYLSGGTLARIDAVYGTGGAITLSGFDAGNTQLWSYGPATYAVNGELLRCSIEVQATAANTYQASFITLNAGTQVALGTTAVTGASGKVGRVSRVVVNPPGGGSLTNTAIGHISVQSTWTSLFNMLGPLIAYAGELSGIRFERLCGEEGIPFRGAGNMSDTTPMDVQGLETFATLLQECADADTGMWFEPRQCLGFGYRTRVALGNQLSYFQLDYNQDHLSQDLSPTQDDQNIFNDFTVAAQGDGSSARATLNDGSPLSIGVAGRYDTSETINVPDSGLNDEAGWYLHISTVNEPRYTGINVDLANTALQSLFYAILDADIGDRITVADPPFWLPPGFIDQLILGCNETLSRKALSEAYNGRPSTPWSVAYSDDVVYGRADTDGSALNVTATAAATTLFVNTVAAGSPLWTVNPADFPFDVVMGGERITVTNITGASSPQTFTVTRSVNGISKVQVAGTDVRLFTPSIESM